MRSNVPVCIIGGYDKLAKSFFKETRKYRENSIFINLNMNRILNINIHNFKIFELNKIIKTIKKNGIKDIIFLGKIDRPSLKDFKKDGEIEKHIPNLLDAFQKGDGSILSLVVNLFRSYGFNVLSPNTISDNFFLNKDEVVCDINKGDLFDIEKSIKILNDLSKYDNAQSIVIVNGYIIAIEAAEGTDKLLSRTYYIRNKLNQIKDKKGILVKIPKKRQCKLVDLPVIGPTTINLIKKANLNGIAIDLKHTMVESKNKTLKLINDYSLKIYNIN